MNLVMTVWSGVRAGAFVLAAALLATLLGGAAAQDKSMTIKLATATLNDAQHEWMKRFAAAIDKSTNGRVKAELYPASQLGTIPRMIEGTQLGSIQIWVGPPEFMVGVDQRFELLSVPGLFQNDEQAAKTIADPQFSKAFLAIGANKGLVGASLFMYGPVAFAMRTPLRTLADLRGKKIRVLASPFQTEQIARLGGTGVPLTLGGGFWSLGSSGRYSTPSISSLKVRLASATISGFFTHSTIAAAITLEPASAPL